MLTITERITELEQEVSQWKRVANTRHSIVQSAEKDLTAMRTLAGELARQLDNIMNGKLPRTMLALKGENARSRAALAKAKKMGVNSAPPL